MFKALDFRLSKILPWLSLGKRNQHPAPAGVVYDDARYKRGEIGAKGDLWTYFENILRLLVLAVYMLPWVDGWWKGKK